MAYQDFSVEKVEHDFSISVSDVQNLFDDIEEIEPSSLLKALLQEFTPLGSVIGTEKARSEFIIAPILAEVRKLSAHHVSLFSGNRFDVDAAKGLTGYCDFLLSFSASQISISAPVFAVVEAKNDNINSGFGQCMAEMVAAQLYNQEKKKPIDSIYGCVTTGSVWRFLKLIDAAIYVDSVEYYLDQLPKILGIFLAALRQKD